MPRVPTIVLAALGVLLAAASVRALPPLRQAFEAGLAAADASGYAVSVAGQTVDVRSIIPAYNPQLDAAKPPTGIWGTGKVWHVGPHEQYTSFAAISRQLGNGDVVEIDAGTYGCSEQSIVWYADDITVIGVGGQPVFDMTNCPISGDKGIFNPRGNNMVVDNISFIGAKGPSNNDAGIRLDGGGYVYITNSYFAGSQDGMLLTPGTTADIVVDHTELNGNGNCVNASGCGHNIYVSVGTNVHSFVLRFSYSHNANTGHEVKSRAGINYILYNRLADEANGNASYEIDIPNGGLTYIIGNVIQKGPNAQNGNAIAYGEEGATNPDHELYIVGNTIVNDVTNESHRWALLMGDANATAAKMIDNLLVDLPAGHLADGSGASLVREQGDIQTNSPAFADEPNRIYYLTASSPAIDAGIDPGTVHGFSLAPLYEFNLPNNPTPRTTTGSAIDVGAYEYASGQSIPSAPTVSLSAVSPVDFNTSATLTWSSTNTTSCTASGDWSGPQATNGTYVTPALVSNKSYTILCEGPGGSTSKTISVTVNASAEAKGLGTYTWQEVPGSTLASVCPANFKNPPGMSTPHAPYPNWAVYTYADDFGTGPWCAGGGGTGVYVPDTNTWYLFGAGQGARNYYGNEVYGFDLTTEKPELVTLPAHISQMKEYTPSSTNGSALTISGCGSAMHQASDGSVIKAPGSYQGDVSWDPITKTIILGPSHIWLDDGQNCPNPNGDLGQYSEDLWSFNPLASSALPMDSSVPWKQIEGTNNVYGSVSFPMWLFDPATGLVYTAGNRAYADRAGQLTNLTAATPSNVRVNNTWPYGFNDGANAVDTDHHWAMVIGQGNSGGPGTISMWNLNGLSMSKYTDANPFAPDSGWTVTGDTDLLSDLSVPGLTYNPTLGAFVAWAGTDQLFFLYPDYAKKTINIVAMFNVEGGPTASGNLYGYFTYIPSENKYLVYSSSGNDFYFLIPPGGHTQAPPAAVSLSASASSISAGGTVTISWDATNASSCTGSGFSASGTAGSATVSPAQTTTYGIRCAGTAGGSATQSVTVTVSAATYSIANIQASGDFSQTNSCSSALRIGDSCTVSITFAPTQPGMRTGALSFFDPVANTTDTIALTGVGLPKGENASSTATSTPPAAHAPTVTLAAYPASLNPGGSATLTWSSTNASSCTGTGFSAQGTNGSASVSPSQTTSYSITCAGEGGSASASASVTVAAAPPAPPTPSGSTVISQIHNAPGWLPNHPYAYATGPYTRVNAGAGWDHSSQTWNPGQPLAAYQLTSAGSCTSGTNGPSGTGSSIKDGTCTWKYLSATDYISITGWTYDNQAWKGGTAYRYHDIVTSDSPLRAYMLTNKNGCTSTVAPAGAGTTYSGDGDGNTVATSDGCAWVHVGDILYSSERSYIPTQTYNTPGNTGTANINMQANYEAQLWNDREYVAGQNGEKSPISIRNHDSYYGEGGTLICSSSKCPHVIVTTAPGESFADSLTPSDPLTGFDPAKGVAILDSDGYRWPVQPDGLFIENYVDVIGLQIQSAHGAAVGSLSAGYDNDVTIRDSILDGGHPDQWTDQAAVSVDTASVVANSLVISHGPVGIHFKYPGDALHDTIVNPDHVADSVGITTWHNWVFKGQTVSNTAIFGFAHAAASTAEVTSSGPAITWLGSNNVTDVPQGDAAASTPGGVVYALPGTSYGASASAAFDNPAGDWRVKSGGPLAGTGNAYGTFGIYCGDGGDRPDPNCAARVDYNFDTPDLVGTARPQNGSYDIGAWQTPAGGVSFATAHRMLAAAFSPVASWFSDLTHAVAALWGRTVRLVAETLTGRRAAAAVVLSIDPSQLDFGQVPVGATVTKSITVTVSSSGSESSSRSDNSSYSYSPSRPSSNTESSGNGNATYSNGSGASNSAPTSYGGGGSVTSSAAPNRAAASAPALSRSLYRGLAGADVKALQTYLIGVGDLASGDDTGYYGLATEAAVGKLQCALGIVCSGTPSSTGYGVLGPHTRALLIPSSASAASPSPSAPPAPAYPAESTAPAPSVSKANLSFSRSLYRGLAGADVKALQTYLIGVGDLASGDDTGYYGLATEAAVGKLQCALGIVCSGTPSSTGYGVLGPHTIQMLTGSSLAPSASAPVAPAPAPQAVASPASAGSTLSLGSAGNEVAAAQRLLIARGYLRAGEDTGSFDATTEMAVRLFQCNQHIVCSGSAGTTGFGAVGPKTRALLGL